MATAQRWPLNAAPAFMYLLPDSSSTYFPVTQQWKGLHSPVPALSSKGMNDQKKVSTISTLAFASFLKHCYSLSYRINFSVPFPFLFFEIVIQNILFIFFCLFYFYLFF